MKKAFLSAPFLGETTSAGYQKPGSTDQAPDKKTLSFGPIQTPKGLKIENLTRGPDDKFSYEVGQLYDVPYLDSVFNGNIYYRTAGGTTPTEKAKK